MGKGMGGLEEAGVLLSQVEAAQAQALLRQALEKLSLTGVITVDADEQAAELSRSVGDEISRVIQEQRQLEERFEVLISQRGVLKAMPNKTKYKENQKELHEVANQLRQSTKVLCRNLKENPNVAGNMLKIQTERMQLQTLLSTCVVELEDCSFDTLTTTVAEEEARERLVAQTIEREKAATQAVKQLKVQLKEEKTAHDESMSQQKKVLSVLKDQLKDLKHETTQEYKYRDKEYYANSQCTRRVQSNRIQSLENEIQRLRDLIEIEKQVHQASNDFLNKKQEHLKGEHTNWGSRLEVDVKAKDAELEQLKTWHHRDVMKMKDLKEKVQQMLADRELRMVEERRKQEAESNALLEDERRAKAAAKIQALYRGWKVRNELSGGKKKGGAKGKKKK